MLREELVTAAARAMWAMAWADYVEALPDRAISPEEWWPSLDRGGHGPEYDALCLAEYVDQCRLYEEFHGEAPSLSGVEIYDVMPDEIPADAVAWAENMIATMEAAPDFLGRMQHVLDASGEDAGRLGFCFAMESVGSGVSWRDDSSRTPHGVNVPRCEQMRCWLTAEGAWTME